MAHLFTPGSVAPTYLLRVVWRPTTLFYSWPTYLLRGVCFDIKWPTTLFYSRPFSNEIRKRTKFGGGVHYNIVEGGGRKWRPPLIYSG
jgi:hypothetical protein